MTDEQDAMLDAVMYLHAQNVPSDIFPFSWYIAQQFLDKKGLSQKLGIDPPMDHVRLLRELANLGVIKLHDDTLEDYSALSDAPEDVKMREYAIPFDGQYHVFTIMVNNKDVQRARNNLKKSYKAELIFDVEDHSYYHIRIQGDGNYYFRQLRKDGYPYKVLDYAIEQRIKYKNNKPIEKAELVEKKKMLEKHKSIRNLYKDQPGIVDTLSPFVDFQVGSIFLKALTATITENERIIIQKSSNKHQYK